MTARREERPILAAAPSDVAAVLPGLRRAAARMEERGVPVPVLEGKLMRPVLALGMVPPADRPALDQRFWLGALAIQMAHEASLLHDDILDGADRRRGRETMAVRDGVGAALVRGDHYLTGAYRAAAEASLPLFLEHFIEAVERTVAGEVQQGRRVGASLDREAYEAVVAAKSGSLFGAGAVLGAAALDLPGGLGERLAAGRELGTLYQMVDDLLDYCPGARAGKPPLQDYRQRKWTWVLAEAGMEGFGRDPESVLAHLFAPRSGGPSPMGAAVERLQGRAGALLSRMGTLSPGDVVVREVVEGWIRAAREGVTREEARRGRGAPALRAV